VGFLAVLAFLTLGAFGFLAIFLALFGAAFFAVDFLAVFFCSLAGLAGVFFGVSFFTSTTGSGALTCFLTTLLTTFLSVLGVLFLGAYLATFLTGLATFLTCFFVSLAFLIFLLTPNNLSFGTLVAFLFATAFSFLVILKTSKKIVKYEFKIILNFIGGFRRKKNFKENCVLLHSRKEKGRFEGHEEKVVFLEREKFEFFFNSAFAKFNSYFSNRQIQNKTTIF